MGVTVGMGVGVHGRGRAYGDGEGEGKGLRAANRNLFSLLNLEDKTRRKGLRATNHTFVQVNHCLQLLTG